MPLPQLEFIFCFVGIIEDVICPFLVPSAMSVACWHASAIITYCSRNISQNKLSFQVAFSHGCLSQNKK